MIFVDIHRHQSAPACAELLGDLERDVPLGNPLRSLCVEDSRREKFDQAHGRQIAGHAAGSSLRLLLAYAPPAIQKLILEQDHFPAVASCTIRELEALRRAIAETKRVGYTLSQNELDEGAIGISAPIRDAAGSVRAALCAAGPATRFAGERRNAIIDGVFCDAAMAVSRTLGYRPVIATPVNDEPERSPTSI